MVSIEGLHVWERGDWLPGGDGLPDWLAELRERHAEALSEFEKAIAGVVDTSAMVEAEARAWRRAVRDAVAQGRKPPEREGADAIGEAQIDVAQEDAQFARMELAVVACEVLNAIRDRLADFEPHFYDASAALRFALGKGPDGLTEDERQRIERQKQAEAEPAIVDIEDPANAPLADLGEQQASHAAA